MQRIRDMLLFCQFRRGIDGHVAAVHRVLADAVPFSLHSMIFGVPAASAMLCARGFGLRHRVTYALATLGLCLLVDVIAGLSGLSGLAWRQNETRTPYGLGPIIYFAVTWALPFAMLILFVGRKPSLLWSRGAD